MRLPLFWVWVILYALVGSSLEAALVFEKSNVEITAQPGDKQAIAVFPFRVDGGQPLQITQVRTSCGCTTTQLAKTSYQAGEKGEIKAVFAFGDQSGDQFKQVVVKSSCQGVEQVLKLSLLVHISQLATLSPIALFWDVGEQRSERTIEVLCSKKKAVSVQATAESDLAEVTVVPLQAGKTYRVRVRPRSTDAPLREKIWVEVDFGKAGKRRYEAFVYVK